MRKVVLTGGAGAGKTTTINRLRQMGYATVPESAIEVMEAYPELKSGEPYAFQKQVVDTQIANEAAISAMGMEEESRFIFLDRGIIDSKAYCTLRNTPEPPGLDAACRSSDYYAVFALETLNNFTERPETGRTSNQAMSRQTYDLLLEAYAHYGYTVISIPDQPVEVRIKLILHHLGLQ